MDMEVVLQVQRFKELPRILVQHQSRNQVGSLQLAALVTSLKVRQICEPGDCPANHTLLKDVLVDFNAIQGVVQVIWLKRWPGHTEVLWIVHAVFLLVLVPVQIRDGPMRLVLF